MSRLALLVVSALASASAFAAPATPVSKPVRGLYQSIDPAKQPKGWKLEDFTNDFHLPLNANGTATRATVPGHDKQVGAFLRGYVPAERHLYTTAAYLKYDHPSYGRPDAEAVPSWIDEGIPLVPGKGTPTVTYMSLRFLRQQGVPYGGLRKVSALQIDNERSKLDLLALKKAGRSVNDGVRDTHTYKYLETMLTQSGHRITSANVQFGAWSGDQLFELQATNDEAFTLNGYHLQLTVEPIDGTN